VLGGVAVLGFAVLGRDANDVGPSLFLGVVLRQVGTRRRRPSNFLYGAVRLASHGYRVGTRRRQPSDFLNSLPYPHARQACVLPARVSRAAT